MAQAREYLTGVTSTSGLNGIGERTEVMTGAPQLTGNT
jgi:hypothetical protein